MRAQGEVFEIVRSVVGTCLRVDVADIGPATNLVEDLDADSLDLVELLLNVGVQFDLDFDDPATRAVVADAIAAHTGTPVVAEEPIESSLAGLSVGELAELIESSLRPTGG